METSFCTFHLYCTVKTFISWLCNFFALTFDLALTHCAVLMFTAQVWKWRTTARWSEASRERPEYSVNGTDGPHRSSRNSLKRRVLLCSSSEARSLLAPSRDCTTFFDKKTEIRKSELFLIFVDLKLSYLNQARV